VEVGPPLPASHFFGIYQTYGEIDKKRLQNDMRAKASRAFVENFHFEKDFVPGMSIYQQGIKEVAK
jgi:hypothetical protein